MWFWCFMFLTIEKKAKVCEIQFGICRIAIDRINRKLGCDYDGSVIGRLIWLFCGYHGWRSVRDLIVWMCASMGLCKECGHVKIFHWAWWWDLVTSHYILSGGSAEIFSLWQIFSCLDLGKLFCWTELYITCETLGYWEYSSSRGCLHCVLVCVCVSFMFDVSMHTTLVVGE